MHDKCRLWVEYFEIGHKGEVVIKNSLKAEQSNETGRERWEHMRPEVKELGMGRWHQCHRESCDRKQK